MQTQISKRHFGFIDGVRGIAACLVMLQHSLEKVGLEKIERGHFALSWLNLGETGVVAFFFVSGFVIPLSMEKWNNIPHFWINRLFRIYPLYLTLYAVGLGLWLASGTPLARIPQNFAVHLLFIQEFFATPNFIGVAWTLSLEAVWYALFTVLFLLALNRRSSRVTVMAVAAGLAACAVSLFFVRIPMGRVGLLLICMLGLLYLRLEYDQIQRRRFFLLSGIICGTIIVGLVVGFWLQPGVSPMTASLRCVLLSWLLGAAIFGVAFFHRTWIVTSNKVVRYLGMISYSIYLLHPLVMTFVVPPLIHLPAGPYLAIISIAAATIGVSSLTYRYIERPAISLSHKLRPPKLKELMPN